MQTKLYFILMGILICPGGAQARTSRISARQPQSDVFDCPAAERFDDGTSVPELLAEDLKRALLMGYLSSWPSPELSTYEFRWIRVRPSEPGEANRVKYETVASDKSVELKRVEDITPLASQKEDPHSTYRARYEVTLGSRRIVWDFSFIRHKGKGEFSGSGCADILYLPEVLLHARQVKPYLSAN